MVGRARRRAVRRDRAPARLGGLLRPRWARDLSLDRVHDGGPRRGRRGGGDRAVHAAARRRQRAGPGAVRRAPRRCHLRRQDRGRPGRGRHGVRHRIDPSGRPHRRSRQRVRHRGQTAGGGVRRDRRPRRSVRAHDRGRRTRSTRGWPPWTSSRRRSTTPRRAPSSSPPLADLVEAVDAGAGTGACAPRDAARSSTRAWRHQRRRGARPATRRPTSSTTSQPNMSWCCSPIPKPSWPRSATPARSSWVVPPRFPSAITASPRTTCCPPRAPPGSRAGCARPTT